MFFFRSWHKETQEQTKIPQETKVKRKMVCKTNSVSLDATRSDGEVNEKGVGTLRDAYRSQHASYWEEIPDVPRDFKLVKHFQSNRLLFACNFFSLYRTRGIVVESFFLSS